MLNCLRMQFFLRHSVEMTVDKVIGSLEGALPCSPVLPSWCLQYLMYSTELLTFEIHSIGDILCQLVRMKTVHIMSTFVLHRGENRLAGWEYRPVANNASRCFLRMIVSTDIKVSDLNLLNVDFVACKRYCCDQHVSFHVV